MVAASSSILQTITLTILVSFPLPTHTHAQEYPNVLTLRVRMPIVPDMTYPRNFITKIIK